MDDPQASSSQSDADLKAHFQIVADAIAHGRLVPFLGAGVNLCERPEGFEWSSAVRDHLPSGSELAEMLAHVHDISDDEFCDLAACPKRGRDLMRVSQNVVVNLDEGPLYERLHDTFASDLPPTSIHRFIAALKANCMANCRPSDRYLLIATTNYDDLI